MLAYAVSSDLRFDAESSKTNEAHRHLANALLVRHASTALKFSSLCRGHLLEGDDTIAA